MKRTEKIWLGMLAVITGIFLYGLSASAAGEKEILRVGYPQQRGLTERNEYGRYSGYSYEYLEEIAKYTNWEYEFIEPSDTGEEGLIHMLQMLADGELDLLGGMTYNEALAETYDYPGSNYGTSYYVLCTLAENTQLTSSNYYLKTGLKAAVAGKQKNKKLEQFAQMSGIEIEQIFCGTEEEQVKLLEEGKADMLLAKDVSMPEGELKVIASFFPTPFYFATSKGNKDIVNKLDTALAAIEKNNPYFELNLRNKYFKTENEALYLSEEEQAYIAQAGVLKAVAMGGKAPIQYIDSTTGEYRGVSLDVLDYISEKTGLEFEVQVTESFEEYEKMILNQKADIAVGILDRLKQYEWQDFPATVPYLEAPLSLVLTDNLGPEKTAGKRLAVSEGIDYHGKYSGKTVYFNTVEDCFEAVNKGEADYCYGNIFSIQYYLNGSAMKNFITLPSDDEWTMEYCMGVVDRENELLLQILNKTIRSLTQENLINNYLYHNAYREKNITFREYLASNPFESLMFAIVAALACYVVIMTVTRRKDKKNEQIRRLENERYVQISEISNEYLFEYNYKEDKVSMSEKCAEFLKVPREISHISGQEGENRLIAYILEQESNNDEIEVIREDGTRCWVRITTKRIYDNDGNAIYLVGKMTDIQSEKEEKEKLRVKAEKDALTGVYNIAAFRENILSMYTEKKADRYVFYIIDIDFFKQINDTYGHFIGDYVLEEIGACLRKTFPEPEAVIGRLGGDEFVAQTVYKGEKEEIEKRSERIKALIEKIDFAGKRNAVTVSIGAAVAENGTDFESVYKQADKALYEAKRTGRNHCCIYG